MPLHWYLAMWPDAALPPNADGTSPSDDYDLMMVRIKAIDSSVTSSVRRSHSGLLLLWCAQVVNHVSYHTHPIRRCRRLERRGLANVYLRIYDLQISIRRRNHDLRRDCYLEISKRINRPLLTGEDMGRLRHHIVCRLSSIISHLVISGNLELTHDGNISLCVTTTAIQMAVWRGLVQVAWRHPFLVEGTRDMPSSRSTLTRLHLPVLTQWRHPNPTVYPPSPPPPPFFYPQDRRIPVSNIPSLLISTTQP